jgi:toxin secretion/phage lysis holin
MKNVVDFLKSAIIACGAALGVFLGRADGLLITLVILAVADYVTGIVSACVNKTLSSRVGFIGIAKKLFMFALVGVANLVDVNVLGGSSVLRGAIICFYIANEALSIIENAGKLGLPIPTKLKRLMEQLRTTADKDDETAKADENKKNIENTPKV